MRSDGPRRFVLDTNTLISAFLFLNSPPGRSLDCVLANHTLLLSLEQASELAEVFRRPRFERYLSLTRRNELIAATLLRCELIATTSKIAACRDANDNFLLELAIDGGAEAIVTGDADLLVLNPFQGVAIVSANEFLIRIQQ